ncbi:MAG TPA: STAS domain-containing protein [Acidimicrobiales bacterium]|nr:STAS domain-containing protein [Acidimicrobiales bacterium]
MAKRHDGEQGDATSDETSLEVAGDRATIVLRGEVDITSEGGVDDAVVEGLRRGAELITIDLSDVVFMGSSGLASLLRAERIVKEAGGHLELHRPSRAVRDLLDMTHLTERFTIRDAEAP